MSKFNVLDVTEEEYESLLSSGLGIKLFKESFPPNINVYKSLVAKCDACFNLYKFVKHFASVTSAAPEDIVEALLSLECNDVFAIQADRDAGLITDADIKEMLDDLENDNL